MASVTMAAQILSGLLQMNARTIEATVQHVKDSGDIPNRRHGPKGKATRKRARTPPHKAHSMEESTTGDMAQVASACAAVAAPTVPSEAPAASACAVVAASPLPSEAPVASACAVGAAPTLPPEGFVNVARATQFLSSHGLQKSLLPDLLYLLVAAGGDIGPGPHSRNFCDVCEDAADVIVSSLTMAGLSRVLPATGRLPDAELIADGGTVGKYFSRARDNVLLVGLVYSVPTPPYSDAALLACINEGSDGRCSAIIGKIRAAFGAVGANFADWMAQRISVTCGDGALVRGGPDAKHSSTDALTAVWCSERKPRVMWDMFHLVDKAGAAAFRESATAAELFELLKKRSAQIFGGS